MPYAVPSRWRTQVLPARGVLTMAILMRAFRSHKLPACGLGNHKLAACGYDGHLTYITHLPLRAGGAVPRFRPPTAVVVALALAGGSAAILALRPEESGLIPTDLPPADRQLVEFLLLLPVAALVSSVIRNVIGLPTYRTFAPALL